MAYARDIVNIFKDNGMLIIKATFYKFVKGDNTFLFDLFERSEKMVYAILSAHNNLTNDIRFDSCNS